MNAHTNSPEVLMTGILLGECPRWHEGRLWFSDWVANKLYALDETGNSAVMAEVASIPFCAGWLADGRLLVLNSARRAVEVQGADGSFSIHADLSSFGDTPWNEMVVAPSGHIYLNNIAFQFPGGEFRPGFIVHVAPDGTLRQVVDGLAFPNGMAVSADGGTLICAESYAKCLTAFDIAPDGSLSRRRVFAGLEGHPDGIALDRDGCVWSALGPRCVRVREGGEIVQRIELDRFCFACALGGGDGRSLFMVAAEWTGSPDTGGSEPTGRIYKTSVTVPAA